MSHISLLSQEEITSLEREMNKHHTARLLTQIKRYPETAYKI